MAHLYGLGPLEGVRGEVSIFGGAPSIARIERDAVVTATSWSVRACFLVWAQVPTWSERVPTAVPAGLDGIGNQVRVLGEIERLAHRGIAVMLSTHDPDHAFLCAHRVAPLHQGRLARLGPPDAVITRESLREVYGVEVTVTEVSRADGRTARVCVPTLGVTERGILPRHPGHPS